MSEENLSPITFKTSKCFEIDNDIASHGPGLDDSEFEIYSNDKAVNELNENDNNDTYITEQENNKNEITDNKNDVTTLISNDAVEIQVSNDDYAIIESEPVKNQNLNSTFTLDQESEHPGNEDKNNVTDTIINDDTKNNHGRNHIRRKTITLENGYSKDITDIINQVIALNPDNFNEILKQKLTEYAINKENAWKNEFEKEIIKVNACNETRFNSINKELQKELHFKQNETIQNDLPMNTELDSAIRERDQLKDQLISQYRSLSEQLKQHEFIMNKAKKYEKEIENFTGEEKTTEETVVEICNRYELLLREAEQQIIDIDTELDYLNKKHDENTVALRYKTKQQEMKINSLKQMIERLKAEKQDLIQMCDEIVEDLDGTVVESVNPNCVDVLNDDLINGNNNINETFISNRTENEPIELDGF